MGSVVIRPRRVARDVLSEPTNRQYLGPADLSRADEILTKADDDWSRKEFRFLMRCVEDIDDAQNE